MINLADTTDPGAREAWIRALQALTPSDRLRLVFEMIDFMQAAAIAQIQHEFPGIDGDDLLRELVSRRYGRELAEKAYPRRMAAGGC